MPVKVTIREIANKLNLTAATVSRALNHNPRISEHTKKAVFELAEKLNYQRNHLASSLRSGKSLTIGVIIPSAEISFFGSVVHGIESIANSNGYNILLYQSNESPEYEIKAIKSFIGAKVDGILASVSKQTYDFTHFIELESRGIPLVFFDRTKASLDIPYVVVDDLKGGFLATEHLIKQGYKKIAHISGPQHLKIFEDRLQGYLAALKAYNIKLNKEFIYHGNVSIDAGKEACEYFFRLKNKPDAVFAVEDFTALGVIKSAKQMKISIPDELGIIGFANEPFGEHITPSLSTIDQQTIKMGKKAFSLLLDLINDFSSSRLKKTRIVLEPVPHFRESSLSKSERVKISKAFLENV